MMYRAIQNLRAYHVTYEKGKVYETLPEGYEKCFIAIGEEKIETASKDVLRSTDKRSKKNSRRRHRASNNG